MEGLYATVFGTANPDRSQYQHPRNGDAEVRGDRLLDLGFQPNNRRATTWTAAQEQQLLQGIADFTSGVVQTPTPHMEMCYWLSHHVMHREFTERECLRKLKALSRKLVRHDQAVQVLPDESSASDTTDSDDEVHLERPVQLVPDVA
jgi:hypothetical protein